MEKIQQLLIRFILDPLNTMVRKLPTIVRDGMFLAGGLGIATHCVLQHSGLISYRFLIFFTIDCLFLGMMILGGMGDQIQPVKFNKFLGFCWFGIGLLMLQSGIRNNVDYIPEAVLFLFAYPVLFICWANGNHARIFRLLLILCRLASIALVAGCFLLIPISKNTYSGLFENPNVAAYFLAVICVGQAISILTNRFSWVTVVDILLFSADYVLTYYTTSRTGLLGILCAVVVGSAIYLLTHNRKDIIKCILKLIACTVATLILIPNLVFIFQLRVYLPLPYLDLQNKSMYYIAAPSKPIPEQNVDAPSSSATDTPSDDPVEESVDEPIDEPVDEPEVTSPVFFDSSEYTEKNNNKTNLSNKTLDQYSTGRISIWKTYASDLNWFGHDNLPQIHVDIIGRKINTPHMTMLLIAYESGILAGVLYLMLNIGSGLIMIRYAWVNKNEQYVIAPLMFTLVFGVLSMLSSCAVSFWYLTTFFYYLVLFPIVTSLPEQKRA